MNPFDGYVYLTAVIGLFGVTLIPYRSAMTLWSWHGLWSSSQAGRSLLFALCLVVAFICWAEASLLIQVMNCLSGQRCGPKDLSGVMLFCSVGIWYVLLELALLLFRLAARHCLGARRNNSLKPTPLCGAA